MTEVYQSNSFRTRWGKLSLAERMGHIGSEITRARVWQEQGSKDQCVRALERAAELIRLTLSLSPEYGELKIFENVLGDIIAGTKHFNCSLKSLEDYCLPFAILARKKH